MSSAGIGHNAPRGLKDIISKPVIDELIDLELALLKPIQAALIEDCAGTIEDYTKPDGSFVIETDEQDAEAAELLGRVLSFAGAKSGMVDKAREAFKRPILDAGTAIGSDKQGPFFNIAASVEVAAAPIRRASLNYKVAKDARIKREAAEAAKKLADEATMQERMAARGSQSVTLADVVRTYQQADEAQQVADAKPAARTMARGDRAGSSTLIYKREVTIINPAAVDRIYCVPDEAALRRAAGKVGTPLPTLAGCTVRDIPDLTVRK